MANRVVERGKFKLANCDLVADRHYGLKPNHSSDEPSSPSASASTTLTTPTTRLEEADVSEIPSQNRVDEETLMKERRHARITPASPDPELLEEDSSSGESDLESCTIEVSGVNEDTLLETVKMFFENRRISGGGEIDGDIGHNKTNENYIITFKERECK